MSFQRKNMIPTDPEKLIPKECQPICQSMAVTPCNSKQSIISVRLNIYFPIVNSQPGVRCSDCHNIQEATIICNMDNLLLKKGIYILSHKNKCNCLTCSFYG